MKSGVSGLVMRASLVVAAGSAAAHADVTESWRRSTDWVAGTAQGAGLNNPSAVRGMPVWRYEYASGGAFDSANPWYKNPGTLLTWDGAWWGTGSGVWSRSDNHSPPISSSRLVHNVAAAEYDSAPMVRWLNPLGNGGLVNIAGTLLLNWDGQNGLGRPDDVDIVIAKYSAASNTTAAIFSATRSKPNPVPSVGDSVIIPIALGNISVNQGDSILISERAHDSLFPLGAWINLYDGLTITSVPAPGAGALLGAAGLLAARRRRR